MKKFPWLNDFEAHWPVDDVLREYFNHRTSYRKDRDTGALKRRREAHGGHRSTRADRNSDGSDVDEDNDEGAPAGEEEEAEEEEEDPPTKTWGWGVDIGVHHFQTNHFLTLTFLLTLLTL